MAKQFGNTEKHIQEEIKNVDDFLYQGELYKVMIIGKPNPKDGKGEPKTDIYCLAMNKSTKIKKEFKISIKQTNADFLENKISLDRAKEIFGDNVQKIIMNSIEQIKDEFKGKSIFIKKMGRTEEGAITIGWKFELLNKLSGAKSGIINLSDEQKIDIYAGTNINESKRNSKVNGKEIENSGIANYILEVNKDTLPTLEEIFNGIQPIEEYAKEQNIYFACKAINFRTSKMDKRDKPWDGNRPLAVYLNWELKDNQIICKLIIDHPLEKKAHKIGLSIFQILRSLKINYNNFKDIEKYIKNKDIINQ